MTCGCGYGLNPLSATHCKQCGEPLARQQAAKPGRTPPRPPGGGDAPRRHVLAAVGGEPVLLPIGETFSLGRHKDCGLTIPSQRVSRLHAEIYWRSGFPVIKNVSSQNPTLVNERAVEEHELRDRDEIQVGPYRCTYRCVRGGQEPLAGLLDDSMQQTIADEGGAAMEGSLEQINLFELLRTFEGQKKTGTLQVRSGTEEGSVVIEKGRCLKATLGTQSGEEALFTLLGWGDGTFSFSKEKKTAPMKIIRKHDYSGDVGGTGGWKGRDLKRSSITDLLAKAEEKGVRPTQRPKPHPAAKGSPRPKGPPPRQGPGGKPLPPGLLGPRRGPPRP